MWLKELKIAIVEKNTDKLSQLMEDIPQLESKEDLDSAICLLQEATNIVTTLRDNTQSAMIQMKKNINFLKVTESKRPSKFDIKL